MNNEVKTGACPVRASIVPGAAIRQNEYRVTAVLTTVALSRFEHSRLPRARHLNQTVARKIKISRNIASESWHEKVDTETGEESCMQTKLSAVSGMSLFGS